VLDTGCDKPDAAAAGNQSATTGGEHILNPVGLRPVGQRDYVVAIVTEHIHGGLVEAVSPPTTMNYHTESGKVTCEWARQAVQDLAIEAGHSSAEHRFSFLR
jgi:hypothetical protein